MHVIDATCRICLGKHRLNPVFEKNISEKIKFCASVQLSEDDELPKMICKQCLFYLDIAYIFRTVCEATDARLRKQLTERICAENNTKTTPTGEKENDNFYFIDSPVALEVIIGEEEPEPEEEITLQENTESDEVGSKSSGSDEVGSKSPESKDKVGRHIAKKKSAKLPKRVPPVEETKPVQEPEVKQDVAQKINEQKVHQCSQCDKSFSYRSHLIRHMSVHSVTKKHACRHCNKKFINGYNLSVHLQKHTGNFPLKCKFCDQGFSSPSLLKRHENSHTGNTMFQCRHCPKKMLHLSSLRLHEKMHVYRPSYTCDVCFKSFSYTNSLAEHKKTHQGIKENVCTVCGKEFSRRTTLKRHMASHSANKVKIRLKNEVKKKLKCDECAMRFSSKEKLIKHLREHISNA